MGSIHNIPSITTDGILKYSKDIVLPIKNQVFINTYYYTFYLIKKIYECFVKGNGWGEGGQKSCCMCYIFFMKQW